MTDDLAAIDRRLGEIRAEIESIPRPIFWGDPDQIRLSHLREEERILAARMIACLGGEHPEKRVGTTRRYRVVELF